MSSFYSLYNFLKLSFSIFNSLSLLISPKKFCLFIDLFWMKLLTFFVSDEENSFFYGGLFCFGLLCVLFGLLLMWPLFLGLSAHSLLVGT